MRHENLGIDVKTGYHNRQLTRAESLFIGILWVDYVGDGNKISALDLAARYAYGMGGPVNLQECQFKIREQWKREVRYMQNHLLMQHRHIPIISRSGTNGGYWISDKKEELKRFYAELRQRGMTGLIKATCGRKAGVVEAVEQLSFDFDDLVDRTPGITREITQDGAHMAPEIVDKLLAKMTHDPEKFAADIRRLREKYFAGGVLLSRERVTAMRAKTAELQAMIDGLRG